LAKRELAALRRAGRTVFFTSHALADVAEMCDRLAVIHAGQLRFAGTPQELIGRTGAPDLERAFLDCISN
jgi:ABC-2 type transport system ATP-binding protein